MSVKILEISPVALIVPAVLDKNSLINQFKGKICGNDRALSEVEESLQNQISKPLRISMVLVETSPGSGSPNGEIIAASCEAISHRPERLVQPSLPAVGVLADFFSEEVDVRRMIPFMHNGKICSVVWYRSAWPRFNTSPVLRFHKDEDKVHSSIWVMLPIGH